MVCGPGNTQGARGILNARLGVLLLAFALVNLGCSRDNASASPSSSPAAQAAAAGPAAKNIEPAGPVMNIDAARAMQYTKEIVAFGPRSDGSKELDMVRAYIKNKLKADQVEEDSFVAETSVGKIPMTNIKIGR